MEPPSDAWQGQKNLLGVFFFVCVCVWRVSEVYVSCERIGLPPVSPGDNIFILCGTLGTASAKQACV